MLDPNRMTTSLYTPSATDQPSSLFGESSKSEMNPAPKKAALCFRKLAERAENQAAGSNISLPSLHKETANASEKGKKDNENGKKNVSDRIKALQSNIRLAVPQNGLPPIRSVNQVNALKIEELAKQPAENLAGDVNMAKQPAEPQTTPILPAEEEDQKNYWFNWSMSGWFGGATPVEVSKSQEHENDQTVSQALSEDNQTNYWLSWAMPSTWFNWAPPAEAESSRGSAKEEGKVSEPAGDKTETIPPRLPNDMLRNRARPQGKRPPSRAFRS